MESIISTNKFYTYAKTWGDKVLVREVVGSKRTTDTVPFEPTLFVRNTKNENTGWKSFFEGTPLEPIKFSSLREGKSFIDRYKDTHGFEVHGFTRFEYQWINENYPSTVNYDLSKLNIVTLDIECIDPSGDITGFPDIQTANVPIVMVSLHSSLDDSLVVFGLEDFNKTPDDKFTYVKFSSEEALLTHLVSWFQTNQPDVITGWNISQFDVPYLVNRIIRLFDEGMAKRLSPFGYIQEKKVKIRGDDVQTYDILGIIELDYLELYKKFGTYSQKESYALGFIANEELGTGKVELPGDTFLDSYLNHFDTFTRYNAIDSHLVKQLEDKLQLISLAFSIAYLAHCNIQDIYKTVLPWEVFIFNHLASKGVAVPPKQHNEIGDVEGAWVKDPRPGLYGWCMTFDFSSLYPSIIRQWNISPETLTSKEYKLRHVDFLEMTSDARAAIKEAKSNGWSLAANGVMFSREKMGLLPELVKITMDGRKEAKKNMLALQSEYQRTGDENLVPQISALNNAQMALKILGNSLYGAVGQESFAYYDYRIAEAITLTGQFSDIHLAGMINDKLNSVLKTKDVDYIISGDTDSIMINCQPLIDKFASTLDFKKKISFLDKFAQDTCQRVIDASVKEVYDLFNCFEMVMSSKREAIASKALFRAKKNYAMYVHDSEGVAYDPPKLKVMGIEVVRASTPAWARERLRNTIKMIFETDEKSIQKEFSKNQDEFMKASPEEIAFPRGMNDYDKWVDKNGNTHPRVPIHVRSAWVYNKHTNGDKLQNGDKVKFIYLKMPNPLGQDVIGFPTSGKFPRGTIDEKYIDRRLQFEKAYVGPFESLIKCAGWSKEERVDMNDLFS